MDRQIGLRSIRSIPRSTQLLSSSSIASSNHISIVCLPQWHRQGVGKRSDYAPNQRRYAHTKRHVSTAASLPSHVDAMTSSEAESTSASAPMSCLPISTLIRSYVITSVSSIPLLLRPSLAVLSFLAHSKSALMNPDSNPLLKMMLKRTFYAQFCAGETPAEVRKTLDGLKSMGYHGAILGHAREVVLSKQEEAELDMQTNTAEQAEINAQEIAAWRTNTLNTIELAQTGDFVALKFTGAGRQALQHLKSTIPCATDFENAVHEICQLAEKRGVSLLFDAEQASLQQGIDNWTLYFAKHYNKGKNAVVYGTYQAYAKRTPELLAQHLHEANKNKFVLGVKLVRGAYLGSDPRHLFWNTIEETHECYDNLAKCVLEREYGGQLQPVSGASTEFPRTSLVLASHNANSVAAARKLRDEQARMGKERIPLAYGQLMGMADNVSCEIVQEARQRKDIASNMTEVPQAYKYLVWGTMGECMKYLLRRAHENKDAVSRTTEARQALGYEIARRMGLTR